MTSPRIMDTGKERIQNRKWNFLRETERERKGAAVTVPSLLCVKWPSLPRGHIQCADWQSTVARFQGLPEVSSSVRILWFWFLLDLTTAGVANSFCLVEFHYYGIVVKFNWVNLIGLRAPKRIRQASVWVCLGSSWGSDCGNCVEPLACCSLALSPCSVSQLPWTEEPCSVLPFCHGVSALEAANHGLNGLKPWAKWNLSSCTWWVSGSVSWWWENWLTHICPDSGEDDEGSRICLGNSSLPSPL